MQESTQAEWLQGAITVEREGADVRREFIQKTYIHFLAGLIAFCGVTWAVMGSALVMGPDGPGFLTTTTGLIICLVGMIGLQLSYRRLFASANMKVHYAAYTVTIALEACFCAPLFYLAQRFGDHILRDAFMLSMLMFGGLTAIPFVTKKDFSFMGGFLTIATMALLGVLLLSLLFGGFNMGILFSGGVLLLFGGWILHDTSVIQRHLPLSGYVFGATMLFVDFVVVLRQVVILLMHFGGDD